jgi:hypothetical protein
MRDLRRHRGKHHCSLMSLTPITFDTNTFSCYGGSYFATIVVFIISCRRPLNLVGPSMPTSPSMFTSATITTSSEYVPLQNCLLPLLFCPRGHCNCLHLHFRQFFLQSYITRAWGMPASFVHTSIFTHLVEGQALKIPFFSNGLLYTVSFLLSLTTPFSTKETLMNFGYTLFS